MSLITGSPIGTLTAQEDTYIDSAPYIFIQNAVAAPYKNPDSLGFYWGVSGSTDYPLYKLGCPVDVSLTEGLSVNDVRCDNVGLKNTIQQRDYIDFVFTLKSLFPFAVLTAVLNGSIVSRSAPVEGFGLGKINNNLFWHVYAPTVYDTDSGDLFIVYLHKAKCLGAWTIDMAYGDQWTVSGVKLRAFADDTKPETQKFGVFIRSDASAIT